jgi:hypothetical protein
MIIFAYVTIYSVKAIHGDYLPFSEIPPNLLILMGVSTGSMVASKAITGVQATQGTVKTTKNSGNPKASIGNQVIQNMAAPNTVNQTRPIILKTSFDFKDLVCDDDGTVALDKIQMMAWTFIALVIYLILIIQQVNAQGSYYLPNVDATLLILMGISHGAYLGKKLTNSTTPSLTSLVPNPASIAGNITLTGQHFGNGLGGQVKIIDPKDNHLYYPSIVGWQDGTISCIVPNIPESSYNISVIVGGKETNPLTITVIK